MNLISHVLKAGCGAGILLGVSYLSETAYYLALRALENSGVIERLAPQISVSTNHYQKQTAVTTFLSSWAVLVIALHPSVLQPLLDCADPQLNWLEIAATCWFGVAAHDLWFFLVHTTLHKTKWLYRMIHVTHHKLGGDLTVFGTADMDPFEAIVMIFGFYAGLLLLYVKIGRWNPIAYVAFLLLEANMNMMGHCGYRQPVWLALVQSWGVYLTPGVAHAKTHYIHHLDPRYNRALYFSWWDRAAGTFRDTHPHIRELSKAEQREYELRAPRMLLRWLLKLQAP